MGRQCGKEKVLLTICFLILLPNSQQLLEYDRNSAQRTRVIDDEADYFNTDDKCVERHYYSASGKPTCCPICVSRWLSKEERDAVQARENALRQKKEAARTERKFTVDLIGRRVVDQAADVVDIYEEARLEEDRRAAAASAASAADRRLLSPQAETFSESGELLCGERAEAFSSSLCAFERKCLPLFLSARHAACPRQSHVGRHVGGATRVPLGRRAARAARVAAAQIRYEAARARPGHSTAGNDRSG